MIMYSGMMPICTGIIIVAMIVSSSPFLPRKRSLANANPASEAKKTVETVTAAEAIAEFSRPLAK